MSTGRLLLVEDNDLVARVVARSLKAVEVVVAVSGEQALEQLQGAAFGMALVDVSLDAPEATAWRSGVELAKEIARHHPALEGRIYLFTGHGRVRADVVESGFPVIEKPILDVRAFRALVQETVAR